MDEPLATRPAERHACPVSPLPGLLPHVLAASACGALACALLAPAPGRPVVVDLAPRPVVARAAVPLDPVLASDPAAPRQLALLTADDAARGVYGLLHDPQGPALGDEQRAALAAPLADGLAARTRLADARTRVRATRASLVADGLALADALGPDLVGRYAAHPAAPAPPRPPTAPAAPPSPPGRP